MASDIGAPPRPPIGGCAQIVAAKSSAAADLQRMEFAGMARAIISWRQTHFSQSRKDAKYRKENLTRFFFFALLCGFAALREKTQ
jgi:hypothetical protein